MSARLCPYIAGAHIPELHMASLLRHAHLEQLAHLWCELQDEAPTRSALHLGQILVLVVAWWSLGPATIPGQVLWAVATMVAASLPLALFFFFATVLGLLVFFLFLACVFAAFDLVSHGQRRSRCHWNTSIVIGVFSFFLQLQRLAASCGPSAVLLIPDAASIAIFVPILVLRQGRLMVADRSSANRTLTRVRSFLAAPFPLALLRLRTWRRSSTWLRQPLLLSTDVRAYACGAHESLPCRCVLVKKDYVVAAHVAPYPIPPMAPGHSP